MYASALGDLGQLPAGCNPQDANTRSVCVGGHSQFSRDTGPCDAAVAAGADPRETPTCVEYWTSRGYSTFPVPFADYAARRIAEWEAETGRSYAETVTGEGSWAANMDRLRRELAQGTLSPPFPGPCTPAGQSWRTASAAERAAYFRGLELWELRQCVVGRAPDGSPVFQLGPGGFRLGERVATLEDAYTAQGGEPVAQGPGGTLLEVCPGYQPGWAVWADPVTRETRCGPELPGAVVDAIEADRARWNALWADYARQLEEGAAVFAENERRAREESERAADEAERAYLEAVARCEADRRARLIAETERLNAALAACVVPAECDALLEEMAALAAASADESPCQHAGPGTGPSPDSEYWRPPATGGSGTVPLLLGGLALALLAGGG